MLKLIEFVVTKLQNYMSSWDVMQVGMPSLNDGFLFNVIAQEKAVSITVTASKKKLGVKCKAQTLLPQ